MNDNVLHRISMQPTAEKFTGWIASGSPESKLSAPVLHRTQRIAVHSWAAALR
jgi:hypothetical protein